MLNINYCGAIPPGTWNCTSVSVNNFLLMPNSFLCPSTLRGVCFLMDRMVWTRTKISMLTVESLFVTTKGAWVLQAPTATTAQHLLLRLVINQTESVIPFSFLPSQPPWHIQVFNGLKVRPGSISSLHYQELETVSENPALRRSVDCWVSLPSCRGIKLSSLSEVCFLLVQVVNQLSPPRLQPKKILSVLAGLWNYFSHFCLEIPFQKLPNNLICPWPKCWLKSPCCTTAASPLMSTGKQWN